MKGRLPAALARQAARLRGSRRGAELEETAVRTVVSERSSLPADVMASSGRRGHLFGLQLAVDRAPVMRT